MCCGPGWGRRAGRGIWRALLARRGRRMLVRGLREGGRGRWVGWWWRELWRWWRCSLEATWLALARYFLSLILSHAASIPRREEVIPAPPSRWLRYPTLFSLLSLLPLRSPSLATPPSSLSWLPSAAPPLQGRVGLAPSLVKLLPHFCFATRVIYRTLFSKTRRNMRNK